MLLRDVPTVNLSKAPTHFNGAIFEWKNQKYVIYRSNWGPRKVSIFLNKTDDNYNPTGEALLVKFPLKNRSNFMVEDPRFFSFQGKPYIAVCVIDKNTNCQQQGICELNDNMQPKNIIFLDYGQNKKKEREGNTVYIGTSNATPTFEKNWIFFEDVEYLTVIYKTQPVTLFAKFDTNFKLISESVDFTKFNWPLGDIRGGASSVKVGDTWYNFFHSSTDVPYMREVVGVIPYGRLYSTGVYTHIKEENSYKVLSQSRIPIDIGNYLDETPLWRNAACFCCGAVFENNKFKLSSGYNDHKLKILEIDKQELDNLMVPVKKIDLFANFANKNLTR